MDSWFKILLFFDKEYTKVVETSLITEFEIYEYVKNEGSPTILLIMRMRKLVILCLHVIHSCNWVNLNRLQIKSQAIWWWPGSSFRSWCVSPPYLGPFYVANGEAAGCQIHILRSGFHRVFGTRKCERKIKREKLYQAKNITGYIKFSEANYP